MQVHLYIWVWVSLAVIMTVAEILSPGWLMLPWAIGAALAALLELLGVGVMWQWVAFVGVSSTVLVIAQRLRRR